MENKEGKRKKRCPFFGGWCEDSCALYNEMTKSMGGMQQKMGMCAFNAMVIMLSEINAKTQGREKIRIPQGLILKG